MSAPAQASRKGPKRTAASRSPSAASSPKKPKAKKTIASPNPSNNKTLDAFFQRGAPPSPSKRPAPAAAAAAETAVEEAIEDIEDDFGGDDLFDEHAGGLPNGTERKRSWNIAMKDSSAGGSTSARRKFMKPAVQHALADPASAPGQVGESERPWTMQYAPRDLAELAVHPKKVADVRAWLEGVFKGQIYQRLLVLRGSAGTGKTTTATLLAKELGFEVLEWKNPEVAEFGSAGYVSASSLFAEFMGRAGKYTGLELTSSSAASRAVPEPKPTPTSTRQALLVEEFPSTSGSSSTSLNSFRGQLLQYLAANVRPRATAGAGEPVPLILIISESVLSNSNSADNFTAHRLLGGDILHHPGVSVIEFNAMAPTLIGKALKLVVQKHTRHVGRAQNISADVIKTLAEVGDVRNAVSTLEYLNRSPPATGLQAQGAATKASKAKGRAKSASESSASSMIALRESTIGLFHAIGKVVYNKRGGETVSEASERPPPDLDVDSLLSSTGTDALTFISALHENYILSCFDQYGDGEATLDSVNGCLEAMGDAELLSSFGRGADGDRRRYAPTASEGVRQEEVALHVGVTGIQSALPYPVKRQSVAGKGQAGTGAQRGVRGDQHRMFYPMDLKLWRQREEIQGSLELLVQRAQDGRLATALPMFAQPASDRPETKALLSLSGGQSARQAMLLERLPYMKQMLDASKAKLPAGGGQYLRQMQDVTSFHGLNARQDEESDDEAEVAKKNPQAFADDGFAGGKKDGSDELEKLMLEDDPIDDDGD